MPPSSSRVLRVGVVQAGRIVEERHLRRPERVTIGQDGGNTFVIANSQVPRSVPLFEYRGNRYHLLFSADMEGRVRLDSADVEFSALRNQGIAEPRGELFVLPLPETAKGKI